MWDLIVLVPDHCVSFYFTRLLPLNTNVIKKKKTLLNESINQAFISWSILIINLCYFL